MKKISRWELLDWKTIWQTAIFLAALFLLFYFIFNKGHYQLQLAQKGMTGQATGIIYNKSTTQSFTQSAYSGNQLKADGLVIQYKYAVDGKLYYHYQKLSYSIIDAPRLNQLYKAPLPIPIKIKYNKWNPSESCVDLN